MAFFHRPRLFRPTADNRFAVELAPEAREWIVAMAGDLEDLLEADTDDTKRLFPTAYPDDPELDAGYQILARQQLIDGRREAIETMRASLDAEVITGEQLTAWMGIVNDLRLVLGTRLDVGEEDDDIDYDDPDAHAHAVYHQLGVLLSEIVDAMSTTLPE